MDYSFWAIVDEEDAIVSVIHEKYGEVKAVFRVKDAAENAIKLQGDSSQLRIEKVETHSA
ncbi:hypothetical protein [Citrobacter werkmanii]|uniref:hypothetical protein n=1 Tax=Citrobacter werkmanii TaxID=67827 RepID=UPI00351D73E7